ncbi:MAG: hypothetical protein QOI91_951 [Solirubrobacteraceae bacterium]|jgi:hypothetical protein|nr:hypothetical protein [Solirubrobacteraceae bacterium]
MRLFRPALIAAAVVTLVPAGAAHAGVLVNTVGPCADRQMERPFLPWADPFEYVLVQGGTFEGGATSWALAGAAATVAGNESYYVHAAGEGRSLRLPAGSSATSPSTCVGLEHPTLRLFVRNAGATLSTLKVEVRFEDSGGVVRTLPIGVIAAGRAWQPSLPLPVVANLLPLLPGQHTAVQFRLTPQGGGGDWGIDDVYVDPRRSN